MNKAAHKWVVARFLSFRETMEYFPLYGLVLMVLVAKSQDTAIAVLDEDAVLHCADSEVIPESCDRVRWVKYAQDVRQILLSKPKMLNFPDAARAKWEPDGRRNLSLRLTRLQASDMALYSCEIWRGWDRVNVRNTSLKFKDCKGLPAEKVVNGDSVNLSCPLDNTMATLPGPINVSWVMLKGAKASPITSEQAKVNGMSLVFRPVGWKDASWYRCNYTRGDVHRCYDINLQVQGQVQSHYKERPPTPVIESREEEEQEEEEEVREAKLTLTPLAAALTAVVVAMAAAAAGFFMHRRRAGTSSHEEYGNTDYAVYKHSSIYEEADLFSSWH